MALRPLHEKVLIRPDIVDAVDHENTDGVVLESGLVVPLTTAERLTQDVGAYGTVACSRVCGVFEGDRVLYNRWSAVALDDETVVARGNDVVLFMSTVEPATWYCLLDWVRIRPIPWKQEQTDSGLFLSDGYRKDFNAGLDIDTLDTVQYGVGVVEDFGPYVIEDVRQQWVLFGYHQALYAQVPGTDGVERVFVKASPQTLYLVIPEEIVVQEFGEEAVRRAKVNGQSVTGIG